MTARIEPGQLLGVDETSQPRVAWLAYGDQGSIWAACYINGGLLQETPEGWYHLDGHGNKQTAADTTLDRARACRPGHPPAWPPHDTLIDTNPAGERPTLITIAGVTPETVRWLWPAHVPLGKITVLDGDPGLGKSTLTLDLAARVTTGSPLPDRTDLELRGAVLIVSAEDGIADTIRPRLEAAGADLELVSVLDAVEYRQDDGTLEQRPPVLPGDINILETAITATRAVLVIIDPLAAFLSDRVDTYKDQHVRRALMPLARLAERTGTAIVIVRHLSKTGGPNAIYRGGGSIGIIGAARLGLLVAPDPQDDTRRILAVTKSNLAQMPDALAYRLVGDDLYDCGRIVWEGPANYKANELLAVHDDTADDAVDAAQALTAILDAADGCMWVKLALDAMRDAGFSKDQAKRAKSRAHVRSLKVGKPGDKEQGWKWELPARREQQPPQESEQGGLQNTALFAPLAPLALPSPEPDPF